MGRFSLRALALLASLSPASAMACACGCGIFDTGITGVTPQASDHGLSVFLSLGAMDQDRNREQGHQASADDNTDKRIRSEFYTAGFNYTISPRWMVSAQIPLVHRRFTTTGGSDANPVIETVPVTAAGDALVTLTYTGFGDFGATGLGLGVKLPTGSTTSPLDAYGNAVYDRDTLPGSGSTDLQFSAYHVGKLKGAARWFVHGQYRFAVATLGGYRPGDEFDGAMGVTYDLPAGKTVISPTLQLIGSLRARDTGDHASANSGYQRLLIAPGVRVQITRRLSIYGDIEFPVAQYVSTARSIQYEGTLGQLVAPALFKLQVSYGF